ncbi:MAG: TIGR03663 family protein [Anaerolineales bacterium]|nr:TIGR03663 family protein [Anaerolineales bacterium]
MEQKQNWLERPIHPALPKFTNELALFVIVMLLALVTRFYDLGTRVMSHDESLHTYFSWLLYRGQGYQHSPMMHGPFQFHIIALSYFLFGATDFTARIPSVLFSIATVGMVWYWRRYLGKWGVIIAGVLLVISPYMLFYGRYVRNESFVGFSGIVMLYAMLRHLETGGKKYLVVIAAALALHFTAKETAFIYTAEALIFLAVYFIAQVTRTPWENAEKDYRAFIISLAVAVLLAASAGSYWMYTRDAAPLASIETAAPSDPTAMTAPLAAPEAGTALPVMIIALIALLAVVIAGVFLFRGYTWERIRSERSFDLLMVFGTIVLPMLTPFPIKFLEKYLKVAIPTSAAEVQTLSADLRGIAIIAGFLIAMFAISAVVGLLWNKTKWWQVALVFWVPFAILYTTVFTNSDGFFTGTIGSLGYWLAQQGVERGSQPWYYYILVQIPVYEYLPALGFFLALVVGLRRKPAPQTVLDAEASSEDANQEVLDMLAVEELDPEEHNFPNTFSLLAWWSVISVVAFSAAGERMPWLTYHMTLPMILITGWALGYLIDATDWEKLKEQRLPLTLATLAIFLVSAAGMSIALGGTTPPFQGKDLAQLQATSAFLLPTAILILSAVGLAYLFREWTLKEIRHVFVLIVFGFLAVLTARASFRASYITYDQATEFLVYAHGATGIKEVMAQAKEISQRTTGGMGVAIAYDASAPDTGVSWPFVWYLRDYTNQRSFDQPTRSLRDSSVVIVDEKNFDKIEAALGPGFYRMDYIRMWWPMQDYFGLIYDRQPQFLFGVDAGLAKDLDAGQLTNSILEAFRNQGKPLTANAAIKVKQIGAEWLLKDAGSQYQIKNEQYALNIYADDFPEDYACSGIFSVFKLNRSKDYSRFCEGFTNPQIRAGLIDIWWNRDYKKYAEAKSRPDLTLTTWSPADKMRLYIRQDVAKQMWNYGVAPAAIESAQDPTEGKYTLLSADLMFDAAQGLNLNAPRSLAFAKDGTVYVADSRNQRVLHVDMEGKVLHQWGTFADGVSTPVGAGTFNEPWGVAVAPDGSVYVTDTWNHRIEKFTADGKFLTAWGIFGQGETPEALYGPRGLAVDSKGRVYVTDTGNKRVVVFDANGLYVTQFGNGGLEPGQFDEPVGIAVDKNGTVYVVDTWNQRIQTFEPIESGDGVIFTPAKQWDVYGWFGQSLDNKPFIAVNDDLHVFITDPDGFRVMEFDPSGALLRVWGDFSNTPAGFGLPSGIAIDGEGHVWVTDSVYNRLMRFTTP